MQESEFRDLHVLVVDDDANILVAVQGLLRALAVRHVTTATSGSDALSKMNVATRPIDCVLCDMQMPRGNGLQLLKALRTGRIKAMRPDACFIFVTVSGREPTIEAAAKLDVNGYLVKPVTREKLRQSIDRGRSKYFALNLEAYESVVVPSDL